MTRMDAPPGPPLVETKLRPPTGARAWSRARAGRAPGRRVRPPPADPGQRGRRLGQDAPWSATGSPKGSAPPRGWPSIPRTTTRRASGGTSRRRSAGRHPGSAIRPSARWRARADPRGRALGAHQRHGRLGRPGGLRPRRLPRHPRARHPRGGRVRGGAPARLSGRDDLAHRPAARPGPPPRPRRPGGDARLRPALQRRRGPPAPEPGGRPGPGRGACSGCARAPRAGPPASTSRALAARPGRRGGLHRGLRGRRPHGRRLPGGRGARGPGPRRRRFLLRTSILQRLSGPLCDAVARPTTRRGRWSSWSARTCSWCRSTAGGSGSATTTSSASSCATSCGSPPPTRCSRSTAGPPNGISPRARSTTPSSTRPPRGSWTWRPT